MEKEGLEWYVRDIERPPDESPSPFIEVPADTTRYEDFETRSLVRSQCSAGCTDMYREFREQQARETRFREEQKARAKEELRKTREHRFRTMDADRKVSYLTDRARENLSKALNIHGGFLRKVNKDLDDAADLVGLSDRHGNTGRWRVGNASRDGLDDARRYERAHNWAYVSDLADQVDLLRRREKEYRTILFQNDIMPPFSATGSSPLVRDLLRYRDESRGTASKEKMLVRSRHHE